MSYTIELKTNNKGLSILLYGDTIEEQSAALEKAKEFLESIKIEGEGFVVQLS